MRNPATPRGRLRGCTDLQRWCTPGNETSPAHRRESGVHVEDASEIVRQLADGLDPATGNEFPDDSPYQHPLIIRALYAALNALSDVRSRSRMQRRVPERSGAPWTGEEDRRLEEAFESGRTFPELAAHHERSVGAVKARLVKLGKLAEADSRFRV
jgi:hypothetical protein